MGLPDPRIDHINRLRQWRVRPERDQTLGFLKQQFKSQVERPFKQLNAITELWDRLLPAGLAGHTRLESLQRGVLKVTVDSSARLYELDRLLRCGLRQRLVMEHKGPALRRVQLRVGPIGTVPGLANLG